MKKAQYNLIDKFETPQSRQIDESKKISHFELKIQR